jgi:hypothetical protein
VPGIIKLVWVLNFWVNEKGAGGREMGAEMAEFYGYFCTYVGGVLWANVTIKKLLQKLVTLK